MLVGALAGAFHQNHFAAADTLLVPFARDADLDFDDFSKPSLLDVVRHVVLKLARSKRVGPLGVHEHEGMVVANGLHQGERVGVFLLRFVAEPGDNVGRESQIRQDAASLFDEVEILLTRVRAAHPAEYLRVAVLHRQVNEVAHGLALAVDV